MAGRSQLLFLHSSDICSQKTIKSIQKCLQDRCKIMLKPDKKQPDPTVDTNQARATEAASTKGRSNKIIIHSSSQPMGQLSARKKEGYWWKNRSSLLPQIREEACIVPTEGLTCWTKVCIARQATVIPAIMAIMTLPIGNSTIHLCPDPSHEDAKARLSNKSWRGWASSSEMILVMFRNLGMIHHINQ